MGRDTPLHTPLASSPFPPYVRYSKPIVAMCKEAVNNSANLTLDEGLRWERRLFHSTFATNDQKEGMAAFVGKRDATFTDS